MFYNHYIAEHIIGILKIMLNCLTNALVFNFLKRYLAEQKNNLYIYIFVFVSHNSDYQPPFLFLQVEFCTPSEFL